MDNLERLVREEITDDVTEVAIALQATEKTNAPQKTLMDYYGALKDSPVLEGDSVALQRAMRDE